MTKILRFIQKREIINIIYSIEWGLELSGPLPTRDNVQMNVTDVSPHTSLVKVYAHEVEFYNSVLMGTYLAGIDFSAARLDDVNFRLSSTGFYGGVSKRAIFDHAVMMDLNAFGVVTGNKNTKTI